MLTFEIRSSASSAAVVRQVKALAASTNPSITLEITTLSTQVFGTISYGVTQRRNDIGIRMALGAGKPRVLRMVLGEAGRMIGWGIVLGTVLALATTRLLSAFLFGVGPTDPLTLVSAAVLLLLIGMAAAFAPAWRAARVDPMTALREE